jgi:hypothetical protein
VAKRAGASHSLALRSRTRYGFEDPVGRGKWIARAWQAPGLGTIASIVWIDFLLHDGSRESKRNSCILPSGHNFQERLTAHCTNLNSMKWMLWNDGVKIADFGRVRIGLFLAHPEANSDRFEGIKRS